MRATFLIACLGLMATAAVAQPSDAGESQLKSLADSCSGHKFETTVVTGPGRGSKVKICGEPGQTDAQWIVTLQDSIRKAEADPDMAPHVKEQLVAALRTEIASVTAASDLAAANVVPEIANGLPAESIAPSERAPEAYASASFGT